MDESSGSRSPKTLADVSHLFFSGTEEAEGSPGDIEPVEEHGDTGRDAPDVGDDLEPSDEGRDRTRVLVVTGGGDSPGKSTLAINLAHALAPFGRVALFDADPSIPNARYFLGLPSWHYLSPLTGDGRAAPAVVTDAGVLVADWSHDANGPVESFGNGRVIYADIPDVGRAPLDFVLVDVPASNTELISWLATRGPEYLVAARPGRRGFECAFSALRTLRRDSGAVAAGLVVNGAPGDESARDFHAKTAAAARRLLSMEVRFLGAVPFEPGLGAQQRERGAVVSSCPDGEAALAIRRVASQLLENDGRYGWTRG